MVKYQKPERKRLFFESVEECDKQFPRNDDLKEWEEAGCPELWVRVEDKDTFVKGIYQHDYVVYADFGYGNLMLKHKGKEVSIGKHSIQGVPGHEDVIVLDRDYYGVKKFLWF